MAKLTDRASNVLERVLPEAKGMPVPPEVTKRVDRADKGLEKVKARREEAEEFSRGNHFVEIDKSGVKVERLSTVNVSKGGAKPNHRVRNSHDILAPVLKGKTSAATQRVPGYEVVQATNDWEDYSAARLAKNIAIAGYEKWGFKEGIRNACMKAFVTEEAFLMPYWDTNIGPYYELEGEGPDGKPDFVGMGDVRLAVYGGKEVSWEPGVEFEDARWYTIKHARAIEPLEDEDGYIGGKLKADAEGEAHAAIVTEYLERPCRKWPDGRRLVMAQGRMLFAEEEYPLLDQDEEVVDAPCLHRISYSIDAGSERARGLVQSLIQFVRSFDFAENKLAEFLQLVLVPQLLAPEGAITSEEITDEPGDIIEYNPSELAGGKIDWRQMPSVPQEFAEARKAALEMLGYASNDSLVHAQTESGKQVEALVQKDILAWQDFIEELADVHAAVMRDSLVLVQLYYTEQRLVKFRGRTGWETMPEFKGADIRGQTDVRVSAGSLEPLTRASMEQRIINFNNMFPGFLSPDVVLAALNEANMDRLNEPFEEAEEQANFLIAQIRAGTFWELPKRRALPGEEAPRLDVTTGEPEWQVEPQVGPEGQVLQPGVPVMETELPGWMPRAFDNLPVMRKRFEAFMQSDEWRHLDVEAQEATGLIYDAILRLEADQQAKAAIQQNQTAEQLGAANAARPAQVKQTPSLPSPAGPQGE